MPPPLRPLRLVLVLLALAFVASGCTGIAAYERQLPRAPVALASWDANGDGAPDLVLAHGSAPNLEFLPMSMHGMYESRAPVASPVAGARPTALAVGRFGPSRGNELAVLDTSQRANNRLLFFARLGPGAVPVAQVDLGAADARALAVADVDRDGWDDIAVAVGAKNYGLGCASTGCVAIVNGGASSPSLSWFSTSAGPDVDGSYRPTAVTLTDFTGDGHHDLLVGDDATRRIVLIPGLAGGVFDASAAHVLTSVPQRPVGLAAGVRAEGRPTDLPWITVMFAAGPSVYGTYVCRGTGAAIGACAERLETALPVLVGAAPDLARLGAQWAGTRNDAAQLPPGGCAMTAVVGGETIPLDQACGTTVTHRRLGLYDLVAPPERVDFGPVRVGETKRLAIEIPLATNGLWERYAVAVRSSSPVFAPVGTTGRARFDGVTPTTDAILRECVSGSPCRETLRLELAFSPVAAGPAEGTVTLMSTGTGTGAVNFLGGAPRIRVTGVGTGEGGGGAGGKAWGVTEDHSKYADDGGASVYADLRDLGMRVNRWSLTWDPESPNRELGFLDRAAPAAKAAGVDVIVSVYPARARFTTDPNGFCSWVESVARRYPSLRRFVIGNEVNATRFWSPQHTDANRDAGPQSYYETLASCYDRLKAVDPAIQVIGMGLAPRAVDANSTKPLAFLRAVGAIYRRDAARRDRPIMDALAVHPYPNPSVKPPPAPDRARYEDADFFGIPQLDRVKQALHDAFAGTAQRTTVEGLPIVVDEVGYQSDTSGSSLYTGTEVSPIVSEAEQAAYHAQIVGMYACDADVSDVLFFHLVDETQRNPDTSSGGWQSGLQYPNRGRKPSYDAVKGAIARGCAGTPTRWRPGGTQAGGAPASDATPLPLGERALSQLALVQATDGSLTWEANASAPTALAVTWSVRRDGATRAARLQATSSLSAGAPIALSIARTPPPGHYTGTVTLAGPGGSTFFALDFVVPGSFTPKPRTAPVAGLRAPDGSLTFSFRENVPENAVVTVLVDGRRVGGRKRIPDGGPVVVSVPGGLAPGVHRARFRVRSAKRPAVGVDYVTPPFRVLDPAAPTGIRWRRPSPRVPLWTSGLVAPRGGAELRVVPAAGAGRSFTYRLAAGDPVAFLVDTAGLPKTPRAYRVAVGPRGGKPKEFAAAGQPLVLRGD